MLLCHPCACLEASPCFQRYTNLFYVGAHSKVGGMIKECGFLKEQLLTSLASLATSSKLLGFTKSAFVITTKVADDDVSQRYKQEVMEFGTSSPMFTILATLALLNVFCFVGGMKRVITDGGLLVWEQFTLQILLCGLLVFINLPVYQGLFLRKDNGSMPTSVTYRSIMFALLTCAIALY